MRRKLNLYTRTFTEEMTSRDEPARKELAEEVAKVYATRLEERVRTLSDEEREMEERSGRVLADFDDLFPSTLPPLTADYLERCKTHHHI